MDDARLAAANDLVRRTLAQHGLMPGEDGAPTLPHAVGPTLPGLSSGTGGPMLSALSSGLPAGLLSSGQLPGQLPGQFPGLTRARPAAPLAPGASFQPERFSCEAGARDAMIYVPASAAGAPRGLVMMLHGCTQTHLDFATGTGMNAQAEEHGFLVVYPQQSRGENAQSCWNWFSPGDQRRGRGEPAILAGMAQHVARQHGVPEDRIFVAGLSAGAAMAVILGQTYGDVFAAVGAHSGLPYGAARDVPSAFAAMAGNAAPAGPGPATGTARPAARTIVFHGSADATVHPANGERIAADVLRAGPDQTRVQTLSGQENGRGFTREITETAEGLRLLESWRIEGLGHAWSGGQPGGSYADPAGPDASAHMARFFLHPAPLPA